tara:strand:- start:343 stop:738 length:396 start_codon:yes stop_codon:yes gene_type:complete
MAKLKYITVVLLLTLLISCTDSKDNPRPLVTPNANNNTNNNNTNDRYWKLYITSSTPVDMRLSHVWGGRQTFGNYDSFTSKVILTELAINIELSGEEAFEGKIVLTRGSAKLEWIYWSEGNGHNHFYSKRF